MPDFASKNGRILKNSYVTAVGQASDPLSSQVLTMNLKL
jgi:hypothetical protein